MKTINLVNPNYRLVFGWMTILTMLILRQCAYPGEVGEPPVAVTPVTLSYLTWISEGDDWGRVEKDIFDQFEASQPRITVSSGSYINTTRDHLTEVPSPDVLFVWPWDATLSVVEDGLLLEVTNLWQELGLENAYPPHYITMAEVDGRKYHIPVAYSWTAIYYNKAIFDQYNLESPQTWNEFLAICEVLLDNGITPIVLTGDNPWMATLWFDYLNLRLNGPDFHARLIKGEEPYDTPEVKKVLETWQSLYEKDYFVADPWQWGYGEGVSAVIKGDDAMIRSREAAAMILMSTFWLDETPSKFRKELDFFAFPIIDPSVPVAEVVSSRGYMIAANSSHPSEAMELLTYLGSVEAQSRFTQQINSLGTYLPAQKGIEAKLFTPPMQQGMALVQDADAVGDAYYESIPGAMRGSVSGVLRRFLQDTEDIDTLLSDLEAARKRVYRK
jgi:multiple sugar transport system substrate-binding protein/raffinose/stachyose/melibiose transport system substrate-binding protein